MTSGERNSYLLSDDIELAANCHTNFTKGSGRGGQKVNKTSSAVRLYHAPSGVAVTCFDSRSQAENRHIAFKKLRMAIALNIRCTPSETFTLEPVPSMKGQLYPIWTANVFDILYNAKWDMKSAAEALNVSRSKLEKLIRRDDSLYREFVIRRSGSKTVSRDY